MNKAEIQDDHKVTVNAYLSEWKANHKLMEAGQFRRAKMHAARFIDTIDDKKILSPTLYLLLEASIVLETTETKILAAYLKRSPGIIRSEFQRILTALGECQIN